MGISLIHSYASLIDDHGKKKYISRNWLLLNILVHVGTGFWGQRPFRKAFGEVGIGKMRRRIQHNGTIVTLMTFNLKKYKDLI